MRADRLLSILMLLQARGRLTAGELARELEVSERTIYRDVDALSVSGVPITRRPSQGRRFSVLSVWLALVKQRLLTQLPRQWAGNSPGSL